MKKICWRPHVEFRIRKKVTALWTLRFSRFLSVLTNWLTDWHRKFPLIFDHLHLSDFEKWGLFGKLTPWGVRGYKNLGPHPIRIRKIPPFPPQKPFRKPFRGKKGEKFRILMEWGPKFLWPRTPQGVSFPKSPHFSKSDKFKWSKIRGNFMHYSAKAVPNQFSLILDQLH